MGERQVYNWGGGSDKYQKEAPEPCHNEEEMGDQEGQEKVGGWVHRE